MRILQKKTKLPKNLLRTEIQDVYAQFRDIAELKIKSTPTPFISHPVVQAKKLVLPLTEPLCHGTIQSYVVPEKATEGSQ